jgi:hypothetical protein
MSTSDEFDSGSGSCVADDVAQYEFKSVRTIRGREASTIAKWRNDGWELDTRSQGSVRTEMTFRRVKPKTLGTYLSTFVQKSWARFCQLQPETQRLLVAVSGGLILLMVIIGIVFGIQNRGGSPESATPPTETAGAPSKKPSEEPTQEPNESEPEADGYSYQGPKYEIVTVDRNQSPAKLNQYWVYTSKFDYSTDAYKAQVKMIIADISHAEGVDKFFVEVVTDKEIALAESPSTYESFTEEHGMDYAIREIPKKERTGYVASYSGGLDFDLGVSSSSDAAFAISWWPAANTEHEKWKPETTG